MRTHKHEEIKVRVTASMKVALTNIAEGRITTVSEVAREAILLYLKVKGISTASLQSVNSEDMLSSAMMLEKAESLLDQPSGAIGGTNAPRRKRQIDTSKKTSSRKSGPRRNQ